MKRYKYKAKHYSPISMYRGDADLIRKLAQKNGVSVCDMSGMILQEWAGWKEPELANNPIDNAQEV